MAGRVVETVVPAPLVQLLEKPPRPEHGRSMTHLVAVGRVNTHDVYVLPFLSAQNAFASFAASVVNAKTALLERVFYHDVLGNGVFSQPAVPTAQRVGDALRPFLKSLSPRINRLAPVPLLDYPSSAYRGRKLKLYQRAAEKVALRGALRSDSYLQTFIKHEKLPLGAKRVVPRVIQPRRPEYNVSVGRYLHQLEHHLYRDIDSVFGQPTVMKGYNAFQLGTLVAQAWNTYRNPRALGLDASRFDQHITVPLLRWEHAVYDLYYRSSELRALLNWQLRNRGFVRCGDGGIAYTVEGGRCSGDMNTAMGNCLVMCASVYGLLAKLGLVRRTGTKVHLFNNGDDCVIIGEAADVECIRTHVPDWFNDLGLIMKVEPVVSVLEEVSFCQCQPVYDGHQWRMVREITASLTKDVTLLDRHHATRALRAHCHQLGECGLAIAGGMPILQSYYRALRRGGEAGGPADPRFYESGFYRMSVGLSSHEAEVTIDARCSFYRAFGVPPDLQVAIERQFDRVDLRTLGPVHDQAVSRVLL